mmetsp:Transcript_19699/g.27043  ORF Transcript_19699/g.27043 Transcript_19699/m.27043 type:complete len:136 (-) Transcript_19699:163-570(-)
MSGVGHDATGQICYSVRDTLKALEMHDAVEHLIVWEGLDIIRCELYDEATGQNITKHLNQIEEDKQEEALDKGAETTGLVVRKKKPLLDWLCSHYKHYGCKMTMVSDRSRLGKQFVMGFDGIGGILRYKVDFDEE